MACDEPNPAAPTMVCGKEPHPYGGHFDPRSSTHWDGLPVPLRAGKKGARKRIEAAADAIGSRPAHRVGPPPDPTAYYGSRQEAIAAVVHTTPEIYRRDFSRVATELADSGRAFTSEDVTDVVGVPESSGRVGALMQAFLKANSLTEVGSVMSRGNGSRIFQYQKIKSEEV